MGVNFSKIYELMSSRIGRGFQLISISIDPVTDTPARLQAWRKKLGGQQGWTLLTGPKPDVDRLLKALGLFAPEKEDHAPIVLLGDDRQGEWLRSNALVSPAKLTATIDKIFSSRDH